VVAVDKFLVQETYGSDLIAPAPVSKEVARWRRMLEESVKFLPELGRYEAGVLWSSDTPNLPDNRRGALERYRRTMRRLERNKDIAAVVEKEMKTNIDLGFAKKLSADEVEALRPGRTWVLPWHPVPHPHKPGKWRLVFDASASFSGSSLNSQLQKGEILNVNMTGILLRMREFPIVLCGDITKMFHQVRITAADANIYLFYYGEVGSSSPPDLYRMGVHIFGSICSPAIAMHVLRRAAADADPEDAAIALKEVVDQFYVDNWITSFRTEEEAESTALALFRALRKGGFELAQWGSSSRAVLSKLQSALPSSSCQPAAFLNLDLEGLPTERTLGVSLDFDADCYVMKAVGSVDCKTRREILRATATNFDPLGLLAPVLLKAKLILQSVCQVSADWDAPLDPVVLDEWREWSNSISAVNDLRIPRCYCPHPFKEDAVDLVVFSDASERAFGAICYLRFERLDGTVTTAFVMAKSRVAPRQYVSMPRLELCGCLLGATLADTVKKELRLKIRNVTLFTDSTTNLRWLNASGTVFKAYVGNRIGTILGLFGAENWRYVPTLLNPADDISRGVLASELTASHRYFTGPAFLQQPVESWPSLPDVKLASDAPADPEVKALKFVGVAKKDVSFVDELVSSSRSFSRVRRIIAYALRWVSIVRARVRQKKEANGGVLPPAAAAVEVVLPSASAAAVKKKFDLQEALELIPQPTAAEYGAALVVLIKRDQAVHYARELRIIGKGGCLDSSFPIAKCLPYVDENGLLRVGGRLKNAPVPLDVRHPIILPSQSKVTERIVREIHSECGHAAPWRTLPELQRQYWLVGPRRVIRRVVDSCVRCRRFAAKAATPRMADLPSSRLQVGEPAFFHTGVDYFGPIETKMFRRTVKRWGCLFRCLTTGACHLEMAYALDADAYLCCHGNFKAARGTPKVMRSDRGTNFIGANRELMEAIERLDNEKIRGRLAEDGTEWFVNPPATPHQGGIWERPIQTAKRALAKVLHGQEFTDQSLSCALKQVEFLLNSRPLTYINTDPTAPEPLTPFHLLLGRANPHRMCFTHLI